MLGPCSSSSSDTGAGVTATGAGLTTATGVSESNRFHCSQVSLHQTGGAATAAGATGAQVQGGYYEPPYLN